MILKQSTLYLRTFSMVSSTDGRTPKTGAAPVVNISKNGAALAAAQGPVVEIGSGLYRIILSVTDTDTLGDLGFSITGTGADPRIFIDEVRANIFSDLVINAFGQASIASNIKQNQALNGFMWVMRNTSTKVAMTGLTVTAQRNINGAGFSACANAVTEVGFGIYKINLAATDLNGSFIMVRFTATGADDVNLPIITQP